MEAAAREKTELALQTLIEVASDKSQSGAARVTAANSILDRAWGKPTASVQMESQLYADPSQLSDAELMAIIAAGSDQLGGSLPEERGWPGAVDVARSKPALHPA